MYNFVGVNELHVGGCVKQVMDYADGSHKLYIFNDNDVLGASTFPVKVEKGTLKEQAFAHLDDMDVLVIGHLEFDGNDKLIIVADKILY